MKLQIYQRNNKEDFENSNNRIPLDKIWLRWNFPNSSISNFLDFQMFASAISEILSLKMSKFRTPTISFILIDRYICTSHDTYIFPSNEFTDFITDKPVTRGL